MKPPLNSPVSSSVPVVPLSIRPIVRANRHPGSSEVADCTPSFYPTTIPLDALPSLGVNPLEGPPKCNCGKLGLGRRSRLPPL
ncbi:unnamed protein product [Sphagnum troendelagicum]|uniref:Uncharacterized protein n=1 Tax=Sphagnum troendelagicum TaxID=128251 RepID=A0ABP0U5R8_9BRYO